MPSRHVWLGSLCNRGISCQLVSANAVQSMSASNTVRMGARTYNGFVQAEEWSSVTLRFSVICRCGIDSLSSAAPCCPASFEGDLVVYLEGLLGEMTTIGHGLEALNTASRHLQTLKRSTSVGRKPSSSSSSRGRTKVSSAHPSRPLSASPSLMSREDTGKAGASPLQRSSINTGIDHARQPSSSYLKPTMSSKTKDKRLKESDASSPGKDADITKDSARKTNVGSRYSNRLSNESRLPDGSGSSSPDAESPIGREGTPEAHPVREGQRTLVRVSVFYVSGFMRRWFSHF